MRKFMLLIVAAILLSACSSSPQPTDAVEPSAPVEAVPTVKYGKSYELVDGLMVTVYAPEKSSFGNIDYYIEVDVKLEATNGWLGSIDEPTGFKYLDSKNDSSASIASISDGTPFTENMEVGETKTYRLQVTTGDLLGTMILEDNFMTHAKWTK